MRISLCLLTMLFLARISVGEDQNPPAELLPPGTWVTYQVLQADSGISGDNGFYTIRLLEEETRDGEACRWVEFDGSIVDSDSRKRWVSRNLIPVKALRESNHPCLRIKEELRGRVELQGRGPNETTRQIETFEEIKLSRETLKAQDATGWAMVIFPGLQRTAQESLVKAKVGYQGGNLDCRKELEGVHKAVLRENVMDRNFKRVELHTTYRITHHADVPFGVAGVVFEFDKVFLDADGQRIASEQALPDRRWLLHDFGTDAKSAFKLKKSKDVSER